MSPRLNARSYVWKAVKCTTETKSATRFAAELVRLQPDNPNSQEVLRAEVEELTMHRRFLLCLFLAACSVEEGSSSNVNAAEESDSPVISSEFESYVHDGAANFRSWTQLGSGPSLAPTFCRAPLLSPWLSESSDKGTHGRKLYFLYVKDVAAYESAASHDQPVGQTLVKESFEAIPVTLEDEAFSDTPLTPEQSSFLAAFKHGQTLSKDGKHWRLGPPRDLFVMHKLDASTPGTDEGWVYGTSSLDLEVSSAGRVESCMECHLDATRDRMFGKQ